MFMSKRILLTSVLALGAVHCGASSNRESNTPESSNTEQSSTGQSSTEQSTVLGGVSPASPSPGVGLGQAPPDNTNSGADPTGSQPFERNAGGVPSTEPSSGGANALNDQQIATITNNVNTAEIEQARIAQSKSKNEQVRRFAEMMIEHHGRAKAQQEGLGLGSAESPLSRQLERDSKATLETLKAKTGDDFDRAYLQAQVEAHQKALDAIRQQLRPNAQSSQLRSYLEQLAPQVEQHLEQARALQTGATSSRSGATGMR